MGERNNIFRNLLQPCILREFDCYSVFCDPDPWKFCFLCFSPLIVFLDVAAGLCSCFCLYCIKQAKKTHKSGIKYGDKSLFKQMFWYEKSLAQLQYINQEEKHIDMEESTQSRRNTSVSTASVLCCECVRQAPDSSYICQHRGGKALVQSSPATLTQFWFHLLFSCNSAVRLNRTSIPRLLDCSRTLSTVTSPHDEKHEEVLSLLLVTRIYSEILNCQRTMGGENWNGNFICNDLSTAMLSSGV